MYASTKSHSNHIYILYTSLWPLVNQHNYKKSPLQMYPTQTSTKVRRSILRPSCLEEEAEEEDMHGEI